MKQMRLIPFANERCGPSNMKCEFIQNPPLPWKAKHQANIKQNEFISKTTQAQGMNKQINL
jgi:hypothetical protein